MLHNCHSHILWWCHYWTGTECDPEQEYIKDIWQYMQDTCTWGRTRVINSWGGGTFFPSCGLSTRLQYRYREILRLHMTQCDLRSMRVFFFSQKSHRCPSEGQTCMWEGRWLVALRTPQRRCLRQIDQYEVISVQYYTITVWEQLVELWRHLAVSPWWADHAAVRTVGEKGVHCHCTTTNHCTSHALYTPPTMQSESFRWLSTLVLSISTR